MMFSLESRQAPSHTASDLLLLILKLLRLMNMRLLEGLIKLSAGLEVTPLYHQRIVVFFCISLVNELIV